MIYGLSYLVFILVITFIWICLAAGEKTIDINKLIINFNIKLNELIKLENNNS